MSTYQFFIILHGLRDILVWLVPLLIAILVCVTALIVLTRWMRLRRSAAADLEGLALRLQEVEARLSAIEHGQKEPPSAAE